MVKSGLSERTDVSHYRLALHLTLAFVIFVLLLWNYFKYKPYQDLIPIENCLSIYQYFLYVLFLCKL